jgi:hypothetical protein
MDPRSARGQSLAILCLTAYAFSCRDEQAGPKNRAKTPPQSIGRVLEAPPQLTFQSGGTWSNGAITYLGSRAPATVKPGQRIVLAHYFQAQGKPPGGFGLFVHLVDAATGQMVVNADHEIQEGRMPLGTWPLGKVIEDVHLVPIPIGAPAQLRVLLGFWHEDQRLPVDQRQLQDGQDRMLGPLLTVESDSLPEYHVVRTPRPPVIDGRIDDPVWAKARSVQLVNSFDGRKASLRTDARLLYDDQHLYVAFDCEDPDVWGTLMKRDDPIYNEEVVEIFIDANGDGRTYNEIEVSPNNTVFDAYFPARRQGMDTSWDSGVKTAVRVRGTINDPSDRDEGWSVEMAIPIQRLAEVPHIPPRRGDRWRFNLYRLEHLDRRTVEGQAFSPLYVGDFHHLPRFGWLIFD